MVDFDRVLEALSGAGVEFVIIGGLAGIAHGAARATYDVDIVYRRTAANYDRLVKALAPHSPYLRGAPPGLPFTWDQRTIRSGLNFTLISDLGDIDLLGEVVGGGKYEDLLANSMQVEVYGRTCHIVDLPTLVHLKRAAGRPKDLDAISELEAILEERGECER